jgi:ethanolamine ammonia-lyase small subunit
MAHHQLSQIFVLANEFKEGDLNVGGTRDDHIRRQARAALAALSLGDIARADFVEDQVTEALHKSLDPQLAGKVARLSVAEFKRILLSPEGASWIEHHRNGVSSEAIAAVVKIMTNEELGTLSCKLFNTLPGTDVAIGSPGHFGSRIQPNSPGDDETEILLSILEGLAYGCGDVILGLNPASDGDPPEANARITRIYSNARHALFSTLDEAVISDSSQSHIRVHTRSSDRDDYLAQPATGELIDDKDAARIQALYRTRRPQVQVVVSDGLNANAINENLRSVLPGVRRELLAAGHHISEIDIVIENGRVRAGYHVGSLLEAEVIIHLIGERPGTGINTLSVYLTYGLDHKGQSRWGSAADFDHSWTTAVCGIHRRGKTPETAVVEIARLVERMFAERRSGVALLRRP